MKKLFCLPLLLSLAIFCSCQKQQTEEERKAEVERQVQERLAAERQAQSEQQLAQREADLEAREKALAEKRQAAERASVAQPVETPLRAFKADTSENEATESYSTFYRKLDPYGVWRETSNYGYVWQPYEAERSRSWRPYTNGRWVYTEAGWTWISDEPFGWATYHYGRWTRLRNIGWIWVPGDDWAPAWVSWRKGNDYVGWAPLPPEARFDRRAGIHNWADNYYDIGPDQYCFVPTNEFGARRVETVIVPAQRNVTIVNQTTNVTNITYSNTTIINHGPNYDELRARSRQPIERLRLERQITANLDAETPRSVIRGEVVQIPAPVIAAAQPAERPRNVREKVSATAVNGGWEGIADQQAVRKARAKIKSESTPPPDGPPKTFVRPAQAAAETSPPVSRPPAADSPTQAPVASPTAAPLKMSPAASPKIPTARPIISPTTPVSRVAPVITASPVRELVPSPTVNATRPLRQKPVATATPLQRAMPTPHPPETTTVPPRPAPSPRLQQSPRLPSPSPAVTAVPTAPSTKATNSESTRSSPVSGPSAKNKDQRKAERESRKQERSVQGHQGKGQLRKAETRGADASPSQSATAIPISSPSPTESLEKGEKNKRKRDRSGIDERG